MNFKAFIFPQKIVTEQSFFNAKIEIVEFLGRKSLRVNGLTQSGSIVEDIYKNIFPEFPKIKKNSDVKDILILGLGGGSFAKLCNDHLPQAKMVGVEIDEKIIKLSKEYLGLEAVNNLQIICQDAIPYITKHDLKKKYDLIFADLYFGEKIAQELESKEFLLRIKKLLKKNGIIIFNRFNWGKYKRKNEEFTKLLRSIFKDIKTKKSYSNLIIFAF